MVWGIHSTVCLGVLLALCSRTAECADCPAGQELVNFHQDVDFLKWPKSLKDKSAARNIFTKRASAVVQSPGIFMISPKNGRPLTLMGLDVVAMNAKTLFLTVQSGEVEKFKAEFSGRANKAEVTLPLKGIKLVGSLKIVIKGNKEDILLRKANLVLCKGINECLENPCVHGSCKNKNVGYQCVCDEGWTGQNCNTNIDDCSPNPCANKGECNDKVNGFSCTCTPGWTGVTCDRNIDDCTTKPCVHGTCVDLVNGYKCRCERGWTGKTCRRNIDDCSPDPCKKGRCVDLVGGYRCRCRPGWTGDTCNQNIDDCASKPCLRGTCRDEVNGYNCQCDPGWTGINCDEDIDECASSPCGHRGHCTDKDNDYECFCKKGWAGRQCTIKAITDDRCPSNYMRFDLNSNNAKFYQLQIHPNHRDQKPKWGLMGAKLDDGTNGFLRLMDNDRYTIEFKSAYPWVVWYVGQLCMRTFVVDIVTVEYIVRGKRPRIQRMVPVRGPEWFRLACTPKVQKFKRTESIVITYKHQPPNFNMKDLSIEGCIPLGTF